MLVPMSVPMHMDSSMMDADMLAMYHKCPTDEYLNGYKCLPHEQHHFQQQRMHEHHKRSKKSRPPVEQASHWIALVLEPSGKISKRSSPSMRGHRDAILQEAIPRFQERLPCSNEIMTQGQWHDEWTPCTEDRNFCNQESQQRPQKRKKRAEELDASDSSSQQDVAFQYVEENDLDRSAEVQYRADAKASWEKWFSDAFRAVQQVSCRVIAKEWIKTIHPKKQSTHPYNGKNPRTGDRGDPELTKPPYWPKDVIHKEPDHINKEARTKLLVHLLMNTPHQEMIATAENKGDREVKEITASAFKESLEQKKLESTNKDMRKKWHIVEQIIEVRARLEEFEMGGLDGDTLIGAPDFSDYNRGAKANDDLDEAEEVNENNEAEEQGEPMDLHPADLVTEPSFNGSERTNTSASEETEHSRDRSRRPSRRQGAWPNNATNTSARSQHNPRQHPHVNVSGFHPPQILPGWNEYSPNTLIFKDEPLPAYVTQRDEYRIRNDAVDANSWEQHQPAPHVDMSVSFEDHSIVPAAHFATMDMNDNYNHSSFQPVSTHQMHQDHHFAVAQGHLNGGHHAYNPRMLRPRNPSTFDAYMHEAAPNSQVMHRNCFQM